MLAKATGLTTHLCGETRYAAGTWKRKRRVIIRAEEVCHPSWLSELHLQPPSSGLVEVRRLSRSG
jgi:hypothetical protein